MVVNIMEYVSSYLCYSKRLKVLNVPGREEREREESEKGNRRKRTKYEVYRMNGTERYNAFKALLLPRTI